jgi:hypothetical protein
VSCTVKIGLDGSFVNGSFVLLLCAYTKSALYAPVEARRARPRRLKLPGILKSGTATDVGNCLPCTIGYSNTPKCRFTATPL